MNGSKLKVRALLATLTVSAIALIAFAGVAIADTVTPGSTSGNGVVPTVAGQGNVPDCPAGTVALKITPEHALAVSETSSNGVTVTQTPHSTGPADNNVSYSFTATGGVVKVVYVKAKPDIAEYFYSTPTTADSNITAPNSDGVAESIEFTVYCVASNQVAAAHLRSLTARASARTVNVHWRTASEIDVAGYNVYGVVNGHRTKLNARIIASKGSSGHSYSFSYRVPRGKQAPTRVVLQVINLDGSRQFRSARVAG